MCVLLILLVGVKQLYCKIVAIEDSVGALFYPFAEDYHATRARQHEVEQDVSVTEDEILHVVIFDVFLGKLYQRLTLFASVVLLASVVVLLATRCRPSVGHPHGEVGVYPRVEPLDYAVAKSPLYEPEAPFASAHIIAVR